jgi:hypothetical protein
MIDERLDHPLIDPLSRARHGDLSPSVENSLLGSGAAKKKPRSVCSGVKRCILWGRAAVRCDRARQLQTNSGPLWPEVFWLNTGSRARVGRSHGGATSRYRWELDRRAGSNRGRTGLPRGDP